jgi:hypothetical protein
MSLLVRDEIPSYRRNYGYVAIYPSQLLLFMLNHILRVERNAATYVIDTKFFSNSQRIDNRNIIAIKYSSS